MDTTVETLDDNKVRLTVTVPESEFERAVDAAFKKLAREVRLPGFRPGKAPRKLLEARLGTDVARQQALRDGLPEYYSQAVIDLDVDPIAPPDIDITDGAESGDVSFTAVVEVRPQVRLTGYDSLRVELPYHAVDDDAVDRQLDALRERSAELVDSTRPLAERDYATVDIRGSQDGEEVEGLVALDFLYQVGSGVVVAELDEQLRGTKPGDMLEFRAALPERFGDRAGQPVDFKVLVKGTQEQRLPELTDEWAAENSEFDTVEELRDDLRRRLDLMARLQAQLALREKVVEAAGALVPIPPPETLVNQEARRRLDDLQHQLAHRGIGIEDYLSATGTDAQALVDQAKQTAGSAVLADLALRAVVVQEEITATDDELAGEVARLAERAGEKPDKTRRELERAGLLGSLRAEIARGKAIQFLVEHAEVVDENGEPVDLALPDEASTATVLGADETSTGDPAAGNPEAGDDEE
jgi:trigger factor